MKEDFNNYESEQDSKVRIMVKIKLENIIIEWVKECGRLDGKGQDIIDHSGGKLFDFGSYRLNVHSQGTDIDALVVAPRHIDRDRHFFGLLPTILKN
jgi:poly(A) polymerase